LNARYKFQHVAYRVFPQMNCSTPSEQNLFFFFSLTRTSALLPGNSFLKHTVQHNRQLQIVSKPPSALHFVRITFLGRDLSARSYHTEKFNLTIATVI
jgi:hypothetical protein